MKLDETLVHGNLPMARASFLSIDTARSGSSQPLPADLAQRGRRGAFSALYGNLMKTWVGWYAPPSRRLRPLI